MIGGSGRGKNRDKGSARDKSDRGIKVIVGEKTIANSKLLCRNGFTGLETLGEGKGEVSRPVKPVRYNSFFCLKNHRFGQKSRIKFSLISPKSDCNE